MAQFDIKRLTPVEWLGVGAAAFAFIVSFFSWYSVSASFGPVSESFWASAWTVGFGAWFPMLLLIAAGVLVVLPHVGTAVPNLPLIWLGMAGAALVIILIRWLTYPSTGGLGLETGAGISAGAGIGLFLGILAALVSGAGAFMAYKGRTQLSAR